LAIEILQLAYANSKFYRIEPISHHGTIRKTPGKSGLQNNNHELHKKTPGKTRGLKGVSL
jgi:hypothetical protein